MRKVWKTTAWALTGAEVAEARADKAEFVLLKERQERDKKIEDKGKAAVEDAPPPSTAPPIMGSIDDAKRWRNHTIGCRIHWYAEEVKRLNWRRWSSTTP